MKQLSSCERCRLGHRKCEPQPPRHDRVLRRGVIINFVACCKRCDRLNVDCHFDARHPTLVNDPPIPFPFPVDSPKASFFPSGCNSPPTLNKALWMSTYTVVWFTMPAVQVALTRCLATVLLKLQRIRSQKVSHFRDFRCSPPSFKMVYLTSPRQKLPPAAGRKWQSSNQQNPSSLPVAARGRTRTLGLGWKLWNNWRFCFLSSLLLNAIRFTRKRDCVVIWWRVGFQSSHKPCTPP